MKNRKVVVVWLLLCCIVAGYAQQPAARLEIRLA
jgi:hypothetical protein